VDGVGTGQEFGGYRVLGVLGSGGMGQVLRAHDEEHGRDVALKVLHPAWALDEGYRERFRREARIAARLNEPHVIPIHRYGEADGRLFLDMRLVEGEDLASLLRRTGPLDVARAVDLVGQVARALDAAHAGGLVHRDVKPSNVLLVGRADGGDLASSAAGEDFAYLADFGIARTADPGDGPALTGTGAAVGSTEYMAPERFGGPPPDGRADVYSLACVFFELLTGRRPFSAGDPAALMHAHLVEQPPAPSSLRPGIPDALDGVVLRGLAKDRDQRWSSAGGMAAAARAVLAAGGVDVPRPGPASPPAAAPATGRTTVGAAGGGAGRIPTRRQQLPAAAATRVGAPAGVAGEGGVERPPVAAPRARGRVGRWTAWTVAALATAAALVLGLLLVQTDRRADRSAAQITDGAARLLALTLPRGTDPDTCAVAGPDGEVARELRCGRSADDDGPTSATYSVAAGDAAAEAFAAEVRARDLPRLEDLYDCGSGEDGEGWVALVDYDEDGDEVEVGRLSCFVSDQGDSVLSWTWDDLGSRAVVELRGQGTDGLWMLRDWWVDTADRDL
jgi:serine/threonine-protein kinase